MKIDPLFIQTLVAFAAVMAGFYGVVTRPLLKMLDDQRSLLLQFRTETRADLAAIRDELKAQGERLARVEERLPPPLVHR